MCFVRDMNYISVFINAIVIALMAIYVYQNEKRMEEIAAKHNKTGNSIISDLEPKSLALERMESKLNETTAILDRHSGILQDIVEAEQRGNNIISDLGPKSLALERMESKLNETTAILNRHNGILQDILAAEQRGNSIISDLGPKSLALDRMESKLNETTAILNRHNGILQDILAAEQREKSTTSVYGPNSLAMEKMESKLNDTTAILNRYDGILQEILEAVQRGMFEKDHFKRPSKCQEGRPIDCNNIPDKCPSGVYKVFPNERQVIDVYCEMNLDEGHWTVFQRRENGFTDFYRGWNDYKSGFGNPKHEFWLGNEILHSLTSRGKYEMRIDLIDFDGNNAFAKYKEFRIGDESSKFKLTADGYYGTAGNSLEHHNGHRFSTKDSDNDNHSSHCARVNSGAWWFNTCMTADLNGQYFLKKPDAHHRGVYWRSWKGFDYSLKGSLMMMRRVSS